jgi:hypothetical protein
MKPSTIFFLLAVGLAALPAAAAPTFPVTAGNGALRLTVDSLRTAPAYGETAAPAGQQWLVLAARWENRIDPRFAAERELPVAYENDGLAKHLYVVIDGRTLGTLAGDLEDGAGHRSRAGIFLAKPGATTAGDLVFGIPTGPFASAELRYYDDTTGHFALALAGTPPTARAVKGPVRNQVGEFALYAIDDPAKDVKAPSGFRAIALELRGRSVWTTAGDAPLYDAGHPRGAQTQQVKLLDWPDTRKSLLLLADGEYAYAPQGGTLPDAARFLPDAATGGTLVFFVPTSAQTLELTCTMTRTDTGEDAPNAAALSFAVAGTPAKPGAAKLPLRITDEMFQVGIAARRTPEFAGEKAADGQTFVILDVIAENTGGGAEYFQPRSQLSLTDATGALAEADEITARGAHRPEDIVFVPAGGHRRFELVFRLSAAQTAPKLHFRGGSFEQDYQLPLKP